MKIVQDKAYDISITCLKDCLVSQSKKILPRKIGLYNFPTLMHCMCEQECKIDLSLLMTSCKKDNVALNLMFPNFNSSAFT